MRAHEREAYDRSLLKERYERAYEAANGKPTTVRNKRGYWYVGDNPEAYRMAQIETMAAELERWALTDRHEHDRFKRAVRELGEGWRFEPEYRQGKTPEPAAVKGYVSITANGRGYRARFSDGVTTQEATGALPLQAFYALVETLASAAARLQKHIEELV